MARNEASCRVQRVIESGTMTALIGKRFPLIQWLQDTYVIRVFLGCNNNVTTYTYPGIVQFSFGKHGVQHLGHIFVIVMRVM